MKSDYFYPVRIQMKNYSTSSAVQNIVKNLMYFAGTKILVISSLHIYNMHRKHKNSDVSQICDPLSPSLIIRRSAECLKRPVFAFLLLKKYIFPAGVTSRDLLYINCVHWIQTSSCLGGLMHSGSKKEKTQIKCAENRTDSCSLKTTALGYNVF
jgi:hypothetical protein